MSERISKLIIKFSFTVLVAVHSSKAQSINNFNNPSVGSRACVSMSLIKKSAAVYTSDLHAHSFRVLNRCNQEMIVHIYYMGKFKRQVIVPASSSVETAVLSGPNETQIMYRWRLSNL